MICESQVSRFLLVLWATPSMSRPHEPLISGRAVGEDVSLPTHTGTYTHVCMCLYIHFEYEFGCVYIYTYQTCVYIHICKPIDVHVLCAATYLLCILTPRGVLAPKFGVPAQLPSAAMAGKEAAEAIAAIAEKSTAQLPWPGMGSFESYTLRNWLPDCYPEPKILNPKPLIWNLGYEAVLLGLVKLQGVV